MNYIKITKNKTPDIEQPVYFRTKAPRLNYLETSSTSSTLSTGQMRSAITL